MHPRRLVATALLAAALGPLGCGHECRDLGSDYADALAAARRCDPAAADACSRQVPGALDRSSCPAFVDPGRAGPLDDLVHRYASLGCQQPAPLPCPAPIAPRCDVQGGGAGVCAP